MKHQSSRRKFLKQSAAVGAAWWVGSGTLRAQDSKNPLEKVAFASVGVGGKGSSDSADAGRLGNMVAICDIDDNTLEKAAPRFKMAEKFNDFREMLDKLGDKIDAVTVSTPDHTHAVAAMAAIKKKKHVFVQKPMTWSLFEARALRNAVAEHKVASQMGNQGTSGSTLRRGVELIRDGAIGPVSEVHVWTNRPIWPQGKGRPTDTPPVPKNIHWDLFLGPAAERPYNPAYHPFAWRGWVDFGTGALGDMACHTMNLPVMALSLFEPKTVEADSPGIFENESFPKFSTITYEFGERQADYDTGVKLPPCKMVWYDGGKKPPEDLLKGEIPMPGTGAIFVGEKGVMVSKGDYGGEAMILLPKGEFADVKNVSVPEKLPRSPGHFEEFVIACQGGVPAMSNFNYAGRLTETVLLGNVAMRVGKKVDWDGKELKITNLPEANQYTHRAYRDGWSL